jgi:recyclin-1
MELGPTEGILPRSGNSSAAVSFPLVCERPLTRRILQRHLKRQIISLEGGFQIIADLNTYHAFIASLRQQSVTDDFANLKMLGHVYIVSDAKDLAQIVRDVTRYGGTFRPEE